MKKKLLVVDDSAFDREIMIKVFSQFYDISFAFTEETCRQQCFSYRPDVVYYELRTSHLDLLNTVCSGIFDYHPATPLIIAASKNSVTIEQAARLQGVFYFLIRPFNLAELWDAFDAAFKYALKIRALNYLKTDLLETERVHAE